MPAPTAARSAAACDTRNLNVDEVVAPLRSASIAVVSISSVTNTTRTSASSRMNAISLRCSRILIGTAQAPTVQHAYISSTYAAQLCASRPTRARSAPRINAEARRSSARKLLVTEFDTVALDHRHRAAGVGRCETGCAKDSDRPPRHREPNIVSQANSARARAIIRVRIAGG